LHWQKNIMLNVTSILTIALLIKILYSNSAFLALAFQGLTRRFKR